jgi:predicted O-methyltransferase YrrM
MIRISDQVRSVLRYFWYVFFAKHYKGHGIHSPAVFEFVTEVLLDKTKDQEIDAVLNRIKSLSKSDLSVDFEEFGAGSSRMKGKIRLLKDIVSITGVNKKIGKLLYRIVQFYQPVTIAEFGTSVGISTIYMASGRLNQEKLVTVEANRSLLEIASDSARQLHLENIQFIHNTFDKALPKIVSGLRPPALIFIDGNHRYKPTLSYYREIKKHLIKGIIIIGDIYWSGEMTRAWRQIKSESTTTVDIYQLGIVFVDEMLTPGHYLVRF